MRRLLQLPGSRRQRLRYGQVHLVAGTRGMALLDVVQQGGESSRMAQMCPTGRRVPAQIRPRRQLRLVFLAHARRTAADRALQHLLLHVRHDGLRPAGQGFGRQGVCADRQTHVRPHPRKARQPQGQMVQGTRRNAPDQGFRPADDPVQPGPRNRGVHRPAADRPHDRRVPARGARRLLPEGPGSDRGECLG